MCEACCIGMWGQGGEVGCRKWRFRGPLPWARRQAGSVRRRAEEGGSFSACSRQVGGTLLWASRHQLVGGDLGVRLEQRKVLAGGGMGSAFWHSHIPSRYHSTFPATLKGCLYPCPSSPHPLASERVNVSSRAEGTFQEMEFDLRWLGCPPPLHCRVLPCINASSVNMVTHPPWGQNLPPSPSKKNWI